VNISILDDYTNTVRSLPAFSKLAGHNVKIWHDHTKDPNVLAERLKDTEVLVTIRERTPIRAPLIEKLDKLKLLSARGDYPHIDVPAMTKKGILLCASQHPGVPSTATAELAWALLLACVRSVPQQMAELRAGHWQTQVGYGLKGKTMGIYGYGKIGQVVAGYAKAFGMRVVVLSRETSSKQALADGYEVAKSKESFFEECDAISLQMRLRDSTRGIVGPADLARMKPTAVMINTSRAGLIAPGALLEALKKGRPGMAGVDVYDEEPMRDTSDELINLPNIVATPHLGYVEYDSYNTLFGDIFDQIQSWIDGKPVNMINPEVWKK
jgi:D-3-phosphoglycerate dehydrogenase